MLRTYYVPSIIDACTSNYYITPSKQNSSFNEHVNTRTCMYSYQLRIVTICNIHCNKS